MSICGMMNSPIFAFGHDPGLLSSATGEAGGLRKMLDIHWEPST
jgi:hypothetical protein